MTVEARERFDDRVKRWTLAFASALSVVLLAGAVLRLVALGMHSFWFDEIVAMRVATAPSLNAFVERLAHMDMVGAPLHPFLLRYWTAVWGTSEAAARGLSAAFSILGLAAFAAASWQAFRSRTVTVAATALLAVCPLDLLYAMESRMYSLLEFLTIASWGLLFSFRRSRSLRREAAFGFTLVGLGYTHPLGGLMILALAIGYLIDARRSVLRPGRWLVIQASAFAAILPWVGRYLDHVPDPKVRFGFSRVVVDWAAYGLGLPVRVLPALLGAAALAWFVPARRLRRAEVVAADAEFSGEARLRTGTMLVVWVALPLALAAAYSLLCHPIMGPIRYQVFLMPGLILLLAGASRFRPISVGGFVAVLALVYTLPALPARVYNDQTKPEWRRATRAMLSRSPRPTVVLAAPEPHMYYRTVDYYLPEGAEVISLAAYRERLAAGALDRSREYWLFHDAMDAEGPIRPLAALHDRSSPVLDFGRLTVSPLDPPTIARAESVTR